MLRLLSPSLPDLQVHSCPERGRGGVKIMLLVLVVVGSAIGLGSLGPVGVSPGSCEL